jgi:replicative DNA helicase
MNNNDSSNFFLENEFYNQVEKYIKYEKLNTGFKDLDKKLNGVLPGLYILGADTGFGKTTFILQVADFIASTGKKVLFYSLEMSKFEMHCKSLSRLAKQKLNEDVPIRNIMFNRDPEITENCISEYKKYSDNIQIIEGNFDLTFSKLKESIISNMKDDKSIVVFIDYLQVLQPENFNMTDKANLDYNIKSIKKLSRELFIPIFLISSLNRSSYNSDLSNTAFKESGGIEYTADVLLGLQGKIIDELKLYTTNSQKNSIQIKGIWDRYKSDTQLTGIIKTKLKCLKSRFGKKDFDVSFDFYPKNNYFEEKIDIEYQDKILFDD